MKAPALKKAKHSIDDPFHFDGIEIDQVGGYYLFAEVRVEKSLVLYFYFLHLTPCICIVQ